jgi:hypothetical protein
VDDIAARVNELLASSSGETDGSESRPLSFRLGQNYPNPFNPTTTIEFSLDRPALIDLSIFNFRGEVVRRLADGDFNPGQYRVVWDGKDRRGNVSASGVYFYRLRGTGRDGRGFSETRRMLLLK